MPTTIYSIDRGCDVSNHTKQLESFGSNMCNEISYDTTQPVAVTAYYVFSNSNLLVVSAYHSVRKYKQPL